MELGKCPCLTQELIKTFIIGLLLRGTRNSKSVLVLSSRGETGRHVFLYGYLIVECKIVTQICDAEAADSEHFADKVSAVKDRSDRHSKIRSLRVFVETAVRAGRTGFFFSKASVTDMLRINTHILSLHILIGTAVFGMSAHVIPVPSSAVRAKSESEPSSER